MGSWLPWRKLASNPPGLDWPALPWQARGLYALLLGLADDAGVIRLGKLGLQSLAGALRGSWSELEPHFDALVTTGWAEVQEGAVLLPHFVDSQRAATTNERVAQYRERARNAPVTPEKQSSNESLPKSNEDVTKSYPDKNRIEEIRSEEKRQEQIHTSGVASQPDVASRHLAADKAAAREAARIAKDAAKAADKAAKEQAKREAKEAREKERAAARENAAAATLSFGSTLFQSYRAAFARRYRTEPLRDARTNAHFARIAKRTIEGRPADISQEAAIEEASRVCAAYLWSSMPQYLQSNHAPGLLERDWHKLLTEHRTGRQMTPQLANKSAADLKREAEIDAYFARQDRRHDAIEVASEETRRDF